MGLARANSTMMTDGPGNDLLPGGGVSTMMMPSRLGTNGGQLQPEAVDAGAVLCGDDGGVVALPLAAAMPLTRIGSG
eukprot:3033159-Rhodomonas_salina.3